jgi:hypothetical protein
MDSHTHVDTDTQNKQYQDRKRKYDNYQTTGTAITTRSAAQMLADTHDALPPSHAPACTIAAEIPLVGAVRGIAGQPHASGAVHCATRL